jgi:hypothetical protein
MDRPVRGDDETPAGPIAVLAVRRGRSVTVAPASLPVEGAALATGLTEKDAWVRRIQTPLQSRAKAQGVLPGLLDVQLPFGIEECVIECVGAHRQSSSAGWTLTAAVAKAGDVRTRLAGWAAEGREPHHLDQEGLALWTQALEEQPASPEALRAVVYLGEDRSTLAFGRGDELVSTQGLKRFDPAQALRLTRMAFEGQSGEIDWIWAGPLAEQGPLVEGYARELKAPGGGRILKEPRSVLARAYAIRALTAGPLRCDFRLDDRMHPEVKSRRDCGSRFTAIIGLGAGLILLAAGLSWRGLLSYRESQVGAAVRQRALGLVARLGGSPAIHPGYERRAVSAAWEAVRDRYEPFARARAPVVSRGLSRLLMAAREEGAVLHRLAWNEAEVKAEGRAPSAEVAARLARIVEQETGRTLTVKTERKAEHEFHFTMETQPSR